MRLQAAAACLLVACGASAAVPSGTVRRAGRVELRWSEPAGDAQVVEVERVAAGEGWHARHGPWIVRAWRGDDGPAQLHVKRGAEPVVRRSLWLDVERVLFARRGERVWLVLIGAERAEAIELGGARHHASWAHEE